MSLPPITTRVLECTECHKTFLPKEGDSKSAKELVANGLKDVESLKFEHLRKSDLPRKAWFLLLVPVIGWIALIILKIRNNQYHEAAEAALDTVYHYPGTLGKLLSIRKEPTGTYGSTGTLYDSAISDNIHHLEKAIKAAGPLAWQYQLELAKHQILKNDAAGALTTLRAYHASKGTPKQLSITTERVKEYIGINIVATTSDARKCTVITEYHDYNQAFLSAAAQTMTGNYAPAWDALVTCDIMSPGHGTNTSHLRHALATSMKADTRYINGRKEAILKALDGTTYNKV